MNIDRGQYAIGPTSSAASMDATSDEEWDNISSPSNRSHVSASVSSPRPRLSSLTSQHETNSYFDSPTRSIDEEIPSDHYSASESTTNSTDNNDNMNENDNMPDEEMPTPRIENYPSRPKIELQTKYVFSPSSTS